MPFEFSLPVSGNERWFDARLTFKFIHHNLSWAPGILQDTKKQKSGCRTQLQQLSALRSIDLAIASGLDLNLLLSMLLDHVTTLLRVDAACDPLARNRNKYS